MGRSPLTKGDDIMDGRHTRHDDTDDEHVDHTPPGPADHGRHGGMATREKAPELTEGDEPHD